MPGWQGLLLGLSLPCDALELSGLPVIDVSYEVKDQRSGIYEAEQVSELLS